MPLRDVERYPEPILRACSRHRDRHSVALIHEVRRTGYSERLANHTRYACEDCAARAEARLTTEDPSTRMEP